MTATLARRLPVNGNPIEPATLIWLAFTFSVTASVLPMIIGNIPAPVSYLVVVIGAGGCGWLWLFARTLFRKEKPVERWSLFAVAGIIALEGTSALTAHTQSGPWAEVIRILHNTESFICIGALALVFTEVFSGYSGDLSKPERCFRQMFGLSLGVLITLTILWVLNASANSLGDQWREPVILTSVLASIVGTRFCISFRKLHPLLTSRKSKNIARFAGDELLAKRITEVLQQDKKFATPEFKVADLAELLGEQEYKVTQCITGQLGYRNFNQLINSHRIESAKEALSNPAKKDQAILSVAFDCGFNSIGPFNRAFKQQVGMTPREYRSSTARIRGNQKENPAAETTGLNV